MSAVSNATPRPLLTAACRLDRAAIPRQALHSVLSGALPKSEAYSMPAGVVPLNDPLADIEAEFAELIAQPWPDPDADGGSAPSGKPTALLTRPAPLPSLTVAMSRRRAILGTFDGREGPSELPLQPLAYVLEADVDWLGTGDFDPDRRWLRASRDHGSVLGQHHLRGVLSFSLGALALATVLAYHVHLLGSFWFS